MTGVGADAHVDERDYSRAAAAHLGVEREEFVIPSNAMTTALAHTISALEYPRMGMAYVNDLIAGRVAQDVKVVLSGLGGDEITGGYVGRYAIVPHPLRRTSRPPGLRALLRQLKTSATRSLNGSDPLAQYRQALNELFDLKF